MMISNPFIAEAPVEHLKDFSSAELITEYRNRLNMDIAGNLASADRIQLYRCTQSGYMFFHPFTVAGDSRFYETLQEFDWYYLPWKWEHRTCRELIQPGDHILEVGCGRGDFIKRVSEEVANVQCTGLELNESAITKTDKYEIILQTVEDHALTHAGRYNLVCSFQVLEHISSVHSYLKASIDCLKQDGLLVISVPNNDSFIKYEPLDILNLPPHHMGRWTTASLKAVGEHFNLQLEKVAYEPLQDYHLDWYIDIMNRKKYGNLGSKVMQKLIKLFGLRDRIKQQLKQRADRIHGHTILVVFRKKTS